MAQHEIENNIVDAIELLTKDTIAKANLDKTVIATVVSCVNKVKGIYNVKYQEATVEAYSSPNASYQNTDRVYMLIPMNDIEADKFILGKVGGNTYNGANERELTKAEYNALSEDERNNGYTYYITDEDSGGGGGDITVDDTLSTTSTNPVQNKIITNNFANYLTKINPIGDGSFNFNSSVGIPNTSNIFLNMNPRNSSTVTIPFSVRECKYNFIMNPSTIAARDLHMNLLTGNDCKITSGKNDLIGCEVLGNQNWIDSEGDYNHQLIGSHLEGNNSGIKFTSTVSSSIAYGTHIGGYNTTVSSNDSLYGCHYQGAYNKFTNNEAWYGSDQGGYNNNIVIDSSYGSFIRGQSMNIQANNLYGCSIEGVGYGSNSTPVVNGGNHYGLHIEGYQHLFNRNTTATATTGVHIEGNNNTFYSVDGLNYGIHIEGNNSTISGSSIYSSHIEGEQNYLVGGYIHGSHIEGSRTTVIANKTNDNWAYSVSYNHIEGSGHSITFHNTSRSDSTNWCNHIEGYFSTVVGGLNYSHISGRYHYIDGGSQGNYDLFVSGLQNTAIGCEYVTINGMRNYIDNTAPHTWGYTHISGLLTTASSVTDSISMGCYNKITGTNSHIFGHQNRMLNPNSGHCTIIGESSTVTNSYNFTFGAYNQAHSPYAIAIGSENVSGPSSCMAIGYELAPSANNQVVIGSINVDNFNHTDTIKGSPESSRQFAVMVGSTVSTVTTTGVPTTVRKPIEALAIDKQTGETWFYHNGNQYKMGDIIDALINAGLLT